MQEQTYQKVFSEIDQFSCVFETVLATRRMKCQQAKHFYLAEREGFTCGNTISSKRCAGLLKRLTANASFVLKLTKNSATLAHNMALRVQAGGLIGVQASVACQQKSTNGMVNVDELLVQALKQYGGFEHLPYSQIMQSIEQFKVRQRKKI